VSFELNVDERGDAGDRYDREAGNVLPARELRHDDRERKWYEYTAGQPLQGAHNDQLREVLRERAYCGERQEQDGVG
jgi:hypothetical protein